ncbi:MAG: response regulator, partial [Gemmatimonadota bacterium]|nr:response regulator [Gemmatimonadota bacterium]
GGESLFIPERRHTTVLVIDDDRLVLEYTATLLGKAGYEVIAAENGAAALAMAAEARRKPEVVVTDVVMPNMSGPEVAKRLKAFIPGLHVVYVSAYPGASLFRNGIMPEDTVLLPKPFRGRELLDLLETVLGKG